MSSENEASTGSELMSRPQENVKYVSGTIPRRQKATRVGKADAKRDVAIFLSLIGLFVLLSLTVLRDVGKVSESGEKDETWEKPRILPVKGKRERTQPGKMSEEYEEVLSKENAEKLIAQQKEESGKHVSEGVCDLYLADSSIPGAGMGIFSGRSYHEGDVVIGPSLVLPLGENANSQDWSLISQFGMLLKPHSQLANVRGGRIECGTKPCSNGRSVGSKVSDASAFIASRTITPGEEIFMNFVESPSAFREAFFKCFSNMIREETYAVADAIISDEVGGLTRMRPAVGRGGAKTKGVVDGKSLKVIKKVVGRFDKKAASLLPENSRELDRIFDLGSTALASLNNRTVAWLDKRAVCLDGVKSAASTIENAGRGAFATRSFSKGELIVPAPLFVTEKAAGDKVSLEHCFAHSDVPLLLCPLSFAALINHQSSTSQADPGGSECEKGPNAEYQWSGWNLRNKHANEMQPEQVVNEFGVGLSFDIIAMRNIEEGEEILMDYGIDWEGSFKEYTNSDQSIAFGKPIPLKGDVLPVSWRAVS